MSSGSRIAELATTIQTHTNKLDEYFHSNDIASPSFDINSPAVVKLPDEIATSKNFILEASDELQMLVLGPVGFLTNLHVLFVTLMMSTCMC